MFTHNFVKTVVAAVAGIGLLGVATVANADTQHTVKSGDSLWAISNTYGINMSNIVAANPTKLSSVNSIIFPGEHLVIPEKATTEKSVATTPSYNYTKSVNTYKAQPSHKTYNYVYSQNSQATPKVASTKTYTTTSGSEASAKAWIASHESGGSYTATNGQLAK